MREHFKSEYDDIDAFYLRGDLLRPDFGKWDCCDPVAAVILDLVEAQIELHNLFEADGLHGFNCEAAFAAAVAKRHEAGKKLLAALEDRNSWPDPDLGRPLIKLAVRQPGVRVGAAG
jgi:hypothetical protein